MLTLVFVLNDVFRNLHDLSEAQNRQQKTQAVENLILQIERAVAIFSVFSALYAANFWIERRDLQWVITGAVFILHPLAVFDTLLCINVIGGIYKLSIGAKIYNEKVKKPLDQIYQQAVEQARRERCKIDVSLWEKVISAVWSAITLHSVLPVLPPESVQRYREIVKGVTNRLYPSQKWEDEISKWRYHVWINYTLPGYTQLSITPLIVLVSCIFITKLPQLFWLDKKMKNCANWLAPRFV